MRKLFGAAVAFALLTTGVGVAGASNHATRSTVTGVTKDEIKLGITYVDLEPLKEVIDIDPGNFEAAFNAVIDDLNKKGGINGRKVVPVFAAVSPIGTLPAQEACVKLTEDEEVFAAIGFFLNDAALCYLERYQTPVLGGAITEEYLARAQAPWFTLEAGDDTAERVLDAFAAEGLFKRKYGKLGIVTLVQQQSLLDDVVLPTLARNNIKGTSAIIDAPSGDQVATQQAALAIIERFQADDIENVLLVGNSSVNFSDALAKTDYRPRMLTTAVTAAKTYVDTATTDQDVVRNLIGGEPAADFNDPALQKCLGVIEKAIGVTIEATVPKGETDHRLSAQGACQLVALFAEMATGAGKKLTVERFGKAGMRTMEIPGFGTIEYDPKTHTYSLPIYIFRYDDELKTLVQDAQPIG